MIKESLIRYCELIDEIDETRMRIEYLKTEIERIERKLRDIEEGETVSDKVYGGEGGWQGFVIEGVPIPEYSRLKVMLANRRIAYDREIDELIIRSTTLDTERIEVQKFVSKLKDPQIRRIVNFRCIERMKWNDVAKKMGAGYTSEAVRQAFSRFLQKEFE